MAITPLIENDYKKQLEEYLMGKYGTVPSEYAMSMSEPQLLSGDLTPGSSAQPLLSPQLAMARTPDQKMNAVAPGAVTPTPSTLVEPLEKPEAKVVKPGLSDAPLRRSTDQGLIDYMRQQDEALSGFDAEAKAARESGPNLGQVIGMGLAGLGEAISGKPYLQATLQDVDVARARKVKNVEAERQAFEERDTRNPQSYISQKYRELAAKYSDKQPDDFAGMSAYQISKVLPTIKDLYEAELKIAEKEANRAFREKQLSLQEEQIKATRAEKEAEAKKGKLIGAPTVVNVNEGAASARKLPDINVLIESNKDIFGPVGGTARSINPYDTRAQSIDAEMRAASQQFGRYMEGGVLRKEDEDKYRRMFPKIGDTFPVAKNKLNTVNRMLALKFNSDIDALQKSGYDVSGFQKLEVPESLAETLTPGATQQVEGKTAVQNPAPYGEKVLQGGILYKWNGQEYVGVQ